MIAIVGSLGLATPVDARVGPPRDKQREDLMDQLGLPKTPPKPPPEQPVEPPEQPPEPPEPDPPEPDEPDPIPTPPGTEPARKLVTYTKVRPMLAAACESCHASGASAGATKFVISGTLDADYANAKRLVSVADPSSSALLSKAAGKGHGGGAVWAAGSSKHQTLLQWIEDGARKGGSSTSAPAPTPAPTPSEPTPKPGEPTPKPKPKPKSKPALAPGEIEPVEIQFAERDAAEGETDEPAELEPSWVDRPPAYAPISHEILQRTCGSCHAEGSMAGATALSLRDDPALDYSGVRKLVDPAAVETSPLLTKARGESHGGGVVLEPDSDDYAKLHAWIRAGAYGPGDADVPDPGPAPAPGSGRNEADQVDATTGASVEAKPGDRLGDGTPSPDAGPSKLPFSLPYHLQIHGRFDLSYERRAFKNHPFGPGKNALQTYHHFLFLSRSGADDPFGFDIELVTQQFFEFNARFVTKDRRVKFLLKAGKILVPFGDEPLYHSSYGGKTGFDQQLLPVVWSRPGLALNMHITAGPVSISNDTYAIQGYALPEPDAVLNLQADSSSLDDVEFGVGDRVGISWAPVTAWYSFQVNPLGHGRTLFMQAVDLEFWRLRDVPFLEDLVVGIGGMRADVSGGGPGEDYYHFGSYGQARYYPVDWLHIQYRWGLKTFDNRRGVYFDDTRIDERDISSHNLSIGATWKGLYAAIQLFWNLEKANEQDDDFLRFTVGYAF